MVGYLPNIAEAVIAFLATASVGATWSCCGQDYQPEAVVDRLGQLAPVVLVTADGYRFGGREVDRLAALPALQAGMPTLREVLVVGRLHSGTSVPAGTTPWVEAVTGGGPAMTPAHVRFDHPSGCCSPRVRPGSRRGLFTATVELCSSTSKPWLSIST